MRIPGENWLASQDLSVSAGFNWETLPQRIRWRVSRKISSVNPGLHMHTNKHPHIRTHIHSHVHPTHPHPHTQAMVLFVFHISSVQSWLISLSHSGLSPFHHLLKDSDYKRRGQEQRNIFLVLHWERRQTLNLIRKRNEISFCLYLPLIRSAHVFANEKLLVKCPAHSGEMPGASCIISFHLKSQNK